MTVVPHGVMAWDKSFGMLVANLRGVVGTKQASLHISLCKKKYLFPNLPGTKKKKEVYSDKKLIYNEVPYDLHKSQVKGSL